MNAVVMGNVIMVSIVHIVQISSNKDPLLMLKTAVIWLNFCRFGVLHHPINQLMLKKVFQMEINGKSKYVEPSTWIITLFLYDDSFSLGSCECYEDFGGSDCSQNLTIPPDVLSVNHYSGGLCDVSDCEEVTVQGNMFLDRKDLRCKMTRFQVFIYCFTYSVSFWGKQKKPIK